MNEKPPDKKYQIEELLYYYSTALIKGIKLLRAFLSHLTTSLKFQFSVNLMSVRVRLISFAALGLKIA